MRVCQRKVRNSPSFQRSIDHGQYVIELHAWRSPERASFATFIYEKAGERLLRHFTGSDENEVIRQARISKIAEDVVPGGIATICLEIRLYDSK